MSRTIKHTQKGKFNNKLIDFEDTDMSFQNYCHRANSDKSRQTKRRNKLRYETTC